MLLSLFLGSCGKEKAEAVVTPPPPPPPVQTVLRQVAVRNATELKAALLDARAGDAITLADGLYSGRFVIAGDKWGTATNPIILQGSRNAVLDGGSITTGYVLHLQGRYWQVKGMTITRGLKGIMADSARHCVIDAVRVHEVGEEGIHLRRFSTHNKILRAEVSNTGLKTPDYGEGIYIGSAKSNWATYTNGLPDLSDSNHVEQCRIGPGVTAESIDIKEGTTGGIIRDNHFDATGITGANSGDSWIDVKGNYYFIENNTGFNPAGSALRDGYQVNVAYSGWGNYNVFKNNNCVVNAAGYGFLIKLSSSNGTAVGNKVYTSNTVTGAGSGTSNISLSN